MLKLRQGCQLSQEEQPVAGELDHRAMVSSPDGPALDDLWRAFPAEFILCFGECLSTVSTELADKFINDPLL